MAERRPDVSETLDRSDAQEILHALQALQAREITTQRILLRPFTRDEIDAVTEGRRLEHFAEDFPTPDARDLLAAAAESGEFYFTETFYSPMACLERETEQIVGAGGFMAPPIDEALEIVGYLVPSRAGRRYAREGLGPLVRLGFEDPRVRWVRASAPEGAEAVERLLQEAGFQRMDDTGLEIEYRIGRDQPVPPEP